MKILITGIYGQDGRILDKKLSQNKYQKFGLVRKKKSLLLNKNTKIIEDDLSNIFKIIKHIRDIKPDIIIHLASNNTGATLIDNFYNYYLSNVLSYLRLFFSYLFFSKNSKFIFAGSSMMFDNLNKKKVDEDTNFSSNSYYGLYKIHCHKISILLKKLFNLKFTTVILFNHDSKFRNNAFLLPRLISSIKKRKFSFVKKIYKENIFLDSSHAYDICESILRISFSNKNFDKLILSSGKITKLSFLIKTFLKNKIKYPFKKNNLKYLIGDNTLFIKEFKFHNKKNTLIAFKEIYKIL